MPREDDEKLFERIRTVLPQRGDLGEKAMFGGKCILVNGNMAVGTWHSNLVVRLAKEHYEENLRLPDTRPFDATGRPMKGWIVVAAGGIATKKDLARWVARGIEYAETLPAK